MLFVQLHKNWGWWKSSPRKKGILQPEIFIWLVLQEEGKEQEGAGKLPLKSFGQTIAFNIFCKGGQSILQYASLKCKCYCKMRCVVFFLSLFGVYEWQYFEWELAGDWGLRCDFKTHSYTCQETKCKD